MRIPRIYTPQLLALGGLLSLEPQPSRYISTVLRMQEGRKLVLFNGQGGEYQATLTQVNKKGVEVHVDAFDAAERESSLYIHLGIGISRGERMDWVLQKATELGVSEITPLFTERTEVKLNGARQEKKQQHWQQVTVSACEQCQRNRLPLLNSATPVEQWLQGVDTQARFVLHHRTELSLCEVKPPQSVAIVIGPEGGLTDTEIDLSTQHQFQPLALGPRVLRTETAPLAAISVLQFLWGDLS